MGPQESYETAELTVSVTLRSETPVVDCEINPDIRVRSQGSHTAPPHSLACNWLVSLFLSFCCASFLVLYFFISYVNLNDVLTLTSMFVYAKLSVL